jgi:acetate kinase
MELAGLMRVLVVNAGSSTLKLRLLGDGDEIEHAVVIDPWSGEGDIAPITEFLARVSSPGAVGHRVVHGGTAFVDPVLIDGQVESQLEALTDLAPLHQPRSLAGMRATRRLLPDTPSVACFDTAFHSTMPEAAATYALPRSWRDQWPIRRFGFHGLSHAYAARRSAALADRPLAELRIVSCHLGAGASLCASRGGRSVDTTMGFTPLEGLVMATRCGSVDPGLVLWLIEHQDLSVTEVRDHLEHRSGLAGFVGGDGDMRAVLASRSRGDPNAVAAFDIYVHRLRREIAAMAAALGGVDVLTFTGGVGENAPQVRVAAVEPLGFLGVRVNDSRNQRTTSDGDISANDTTALTLVVTAREDLEIARNTRATLTASA